jgi:hypothetical protein
VIPDACDYERVVLSFVVNNKSFDLFRFLLGGISAIAIAGSEWSRESCQVLLGVEVIQRLEQRRSASLIIENV